VGDARKGKDGEGVGIDVEEAILEVNCFTCSVCAIANP